MMNDQKFQGILVGSDQRLEWILPWWWEHYSAHNDYPVAFFDFGMSQQGKEWCARRGELFDSKTPFSLSKHEIPFPKRILWESQYGEGMWDVRSAWLQKPMALAKSPFPIGLWLDLDCRIDGNLSPLFHLLQEKDDFAVSKYETREDYNSAVIVFKQNAPLIQKWVESILECPDELPGDEDYLSQAIRRFRPQIVPLSPLYNWSRLKPKNPQALVVHFHGGDGKIAILKQIGPERFPHLLKNL